MTAAFLTVVCLLVSARDASQDPIDAKAEICVVGGGSGGFGAALAAARAGADVVLVERMPRLGGTSTNGYVSNWEPGPDGLLSREMYGRLAKQNAVASQDHNPDRRLGPFGLWLIAGGRTNSRCGARAGATVGARSFRPMHDVGTDEPDARRDGPMPRRASAAASGGNRPGPVASILAEAADGTRRAYRHACSSFDRRRACAGWRLRDVLGARQKLDSASRMPWTNRKAVTLNAITLCYRIRKSDNPVRQPAPRSPVKNCGAPIGAVPGGDLIINPLAMMPGRALVDLGYEKAMSLCREKVRQHWHCLQRNPAFSGYEFDSFAPMLGIRESYRVVCDYVLTQHDLVATLERQVHADIIAVADHPMDVHGEGGRRIGGELKGPYGIPYRSLIPKDTTNVLVACRGAGFSQIAASSCRLNRTMLALGHAAGLAAAQAVSKNISVRQVDVGEIQRQLELPLPARSGPG